MGELVIGILIVFGIALVGALVFGGWVIVAIVRLIARVFNRVLGQAPASLPPVSGVRCGNSKCLAENPGRARFCRRCGRMLHVGEPAVARRVAMW
jgi:hypothetical protein